ncbi:ACP S-malonyltransferase [Streptomyces sp. NPDC020801]|uniref:ACP S-malonyltransferase n=1 Tax=unclassified Streptomyces TaxID=2593676 RepID=UPI00379E9F7A
MALAFIIDGGLNDPPDSGVDLYQAHESVRRLYAQVEQWTGLPAERMLRWELSRPEEYRQVGALRQAAVVLGICDVLAERGVRPDIVGGLSLGGMIGASLAGSLERRDLFGLLARMRDAPAAVGPRQGVGTLIAPVGVELSTYLGGPPEGVYVSADLGVAGAWGSRMLLVSGYRDALERLARQLPEDALRIHEDLDVAYHSPLSDHLAQFLEPAIAGIPFRDPAIALCSYMEPKTLTTASDVRDMFRRNQVEKVSLPHVFAGLEQHDTELALLIGSAQLDLFLGSLPFPVVHVERLEQLPEAYAAIHEFGVELPYS